MGFPEEEEKEKGLKGLFKEIQANTPRSGKEDMHLVPEHLQKPRGQEPKSMGRGKHTDKYRMS